MKSLYKEDPMKGYNQQMIDRQVKAKTIQVYLERQKMYASNPSWIPQPLSQANSIFLPQKNTQKRIKFQDISRKIRLNIFDLPSNFKPSVKKTQYSQRSSQIFSENQTETQWRSTSKKVDASKVIVQSVKKSVSKSIDLNNKSNILAWDENDMKVEAKKMKICRNPITQGQMSKIFQSKKRM